MHFFIITNLLCWYFRQLSRKFSSAKPGTVNRQALAIHAPDHGKQWNDQKAYSGAWTQTHDVLWAKPEANLETYLFLKGFADVPDL